MIDASLGRASCCGFPPGMSQPFPPRPNPPVPLPQSEPDMIQIRLTTAQTALANGAAIPLTGTVRQNGSGLHFDTANRAVQVTEAGVYLFQWHVLVQSDAAAPVIALQSLDGQTVLGYSGVPAGAAESGVLVSGSAAAALPAGTAWVLVNASGDIIDIPVAGAAPAAFAASLTVTEIGGSAFPDWR